MPKSRSLSALVTRLVSLIREEIEAVASGEPLPSEVELAAKFDVARKSIRAALDVLEAQGAVQRIRGKGTFAARGRQSRGLFRQAARRFGLVSWFGFPTPGGFYSRILEGVLAEAFAVNIEIVLAGSEVVTEKAEICYRLCDESRIDGLILVSVTDQEFLESLAARGKPLCLVDHVAEKAKIDCVRVDSRRTAELAVEHLVRLGHRRIAYAQPERAETNPNRLEGFRAAMRAHGLELSPDLVVGAPVTDVGGAQAAGRLLALPTDRRPTALMAFSPEMAVGAMRAVRDFGLHVPEDFSVVAGGGLHSDNDRQTAELTAVVFDAARLGQTAVERLSRRVKEPGLAPEDIVLPVELHLGRSTSRLDGPRDRKAKR